MRLGFAAALLAACSFPGGNPGDGEIVDDAGRSDGPTGIVDAPSEDAPSSPTLLCTPAAPDVVACYDFEGNGTDGSGSNDATFVTNPTFVNAVNGQAVELNGTSDVATVAESASLDVSALTLEASILLETAPGSGEQVIFDNQSQWALSIDNGEVRCSAAGGPPVIRGTLSLGQFHHLACVVDENQAQLFIDGDLIGCQDRSNGLLTASLLGSAIGADLISPGVFQSRFAGLIDTLRISSVTRSLAEICAAAGKAPGTCTGDPNDCQNESFNPRR